MMVLAALGTTYFISHRRNKHSLAAMRETESNSSIGLMLVMFIAHSPASLIVFQTFVFDTLYNGVAYLRTDYSLARSSGAHAAYTA